MIFQEPLSRKKPFRLRFQQVFSFNSVQVQRCIVIFTSSASKQKYFLFNLLTGKSEHYIDGTKYDSLLPERILIAKRCDSI